VYTLHVSVCICIFQSFVFVFFEVSSMFCLPQDHAKGWHVCLCVCVCVCVDWIGIYWCVYVCIYLCVCVILVCVSMYLFMCLCVYVHNIISFKLLFSSAVDVEIVNIYAHTNM
jgi:hypothetical protein